MSEGKGKMNNMFTDRVKKVLQYAREESARLGHDYIGTEHLLLGLVKEGQGVAVAVLANMGIQLDTLKRSIEDAVQTSSVQWCFLKFHLLQWQSRCLRLPHRKHGK